MKKAIVVGAGIGGLATSIRLACQGFQVDVFEGNAYPGGKLAAFSLGKYRFDAGPSLFTMPHFVSELFELAGENPTEHFAYKKKEIACQYFWEDGVRLTAYGDRNKLVNEIEKQLNVPPETVLTYLENAQRKYERTQSLFLEQSLHKLSTYLSKDTLKGMVHYRSFEIGKSLHEVNQKHLKEPHLVQMYDRYATYNGSSPYKTPGIMTLVQHLEQHYGTFIPKKGMEDISQSVYQLALRKGVRFHFNTQVSEIVIKQKKAKGVVANDTVHYSDMVVSNMDIVPTYRKLLPKVTPPEKTLRQERSSSAVIFYWGIKKTFKELDLHNIFFSSNYKEEFEAIFNHKKCYKDPTVYVNITSKDVQTDAPKNCENWFVMINTPHDNGQNWEEEVNILKKQVLEKLHRILGEDIAPLIEEEFIMTPPIIEQKTQSYKGALYGASSNNTMAAFLRHPNFSSSISNLYFCGGSVHPGGGIPLCLLSAKIVSDLVKNDVK
jgi:phytoene desaturase